jgi:RNA polymerase sigma factor (sigma-70 family)
VADAETPRVTADLGPDSSPPVSSIPNKSLHQRRQLQHRGEAVGEHNYTNCRGDHTGELAQLVGRVAGGDRVAEGELYRRLSAKVVYWARRYTDSPDDAEDLASDSWELLLGKLRGGALREPSRVTSYCMGVVRRIAATRRRRLSTHLEQCDTETVERAGVAPVCAQPEQVVSRDQLRQIACAGIGRLSRLRDRHILRELLINESTPAQLAPALAIAPKHLHKVACRARGRLRDVLLRVQPAAEWMREAE